MRLLNTAVLVVVVGAVSYLVAHAHPERPEPPQKSTLADQCAQFNPGAQQVLVVLDKDILQQAMQVVLKSNLPAKLSGKSVGIDGQIWASGDNFLEFHDNPSITFSAVVKSFELSEIVNGPPPLLLKWKGRLAADVEGAVRLKKMLARIGSHNTITFQKDPVVDFAVNLYSVEKTWMSFTLDVIEPASISVTAKAQLWGIGIGQPIAIPVPVGTVFNASFADPVKFPVLGTEFELVPVSSELGKQGSYCVVARLTGKPAVVAGT